LVVSRSSTQAAEEQKKMEGTLAVDVDSARVRISEIQTELESVIEQLGEAKVCYPMHFSSVHAPAPPGEGIKH